MVGTQAPKLSARELREGALDGGLERAPLDAVVRGYANG